MKYIDADDVIAMLEATRVAFEWLAKNRGGNPELVERVEEASLCVGKIIHAIDNTPTGNVRTLVLGKWLWCKDHWECSNCRCGKHNHAKLSESGMYFCPHCGAFMNNLEDA